MIEYLAVGLYPLAGLLIAATHRESIDGALVENGLSPGDRTVYAFVVLVWPLVLIGEGHARLSEVLKST